MTKSRALFLSIACFGLVLFTGWTTSDVALAEESIEVVYSSGDEPASDVVVVFSSEMNSAAFLAAPTCEDNPVQCKCGIWQVFTDPEGCSCATGQFYPCPQQCCGLGS